MEYNASENLGYGLGEIAALRDLFLSLTKGVKAAHQYPSQHPISTQLKITFFGKLQAFFELNERIVVLVQHDSLISDEEVVYRNPLNHENLAHILHRDGVRRLEITSGITVDEAQTLFDAFAACCCRDDRTEDIVNLFWQSDFENIKYDVIDVFEVADARVLYETLESPPPFSPSVGDDKPVVHNISWDASPTFFHTNVAEAREKTRELQREIINHYGDAGNYTSEELHALEEMVTCDCLCDSKDQVVELLLQLCNTIDSPQDAALTMEALQSTFDKTLSECNFEGLLKIIKKSKELLGNGNITSKAAVRRIEEFVSRAGDKHRIKVIAEALNKSEELDLLPIQKYLEELGWESLTHLVRLLGELSFYSARKMVCDLLVQKGLDKIDILGAAVFDSRWYVVRNVVWVLGEIGNERALGYIRKAANHSELRVRSEVIKAMKKFESQVAVEILMTLLQDSSDKIRSMAANELGRSRSLFAFPAIEKIVTSKEFIDFPAAEIRQDIEAMVVCGGNRGVKVVSDLMARTTLFNKAKLRRLQEIAINSLQHSDTHEAIELLTKYANNQSSQYQPIAKKALAQLQFKLENKFGVESK